MNDWFEDIVTLALFVIAVLVIAVLGFGFGL
jgi:hypothetical protein